MPLFHIANIYFDKWKPTRICNNMQLLDDGIRTASVSLEKFFDGDYLATIMTTSNIVGVQGK